MRHHRRSIGAAGLLLAIGLLIAPSRPAVGQPARAIAPSEVRGCCVCRGTSGGDAGTLRSCSDGVGVDTCVEQCRSQSADSLAFGYEQSCSQGCAGFPTQSLD
jgi:hypothetical protein